MNWTLNFANFPDDKDIFAYFCTFLKHDKETYTLLRILSRKYHEKTDYNLQNYYVFVTINTDFMNNQIQFFKPTSISFQNEKIISYQIKDMFPLSTELGNTTNYRINNLCFHYHYGKWTLNGYIFDGWNREYYYIITKTGTPIPEFYKINRLVNMLNKHFKKNNNIDHVESVDPALDKMDKYGWDHIDSYQFWPQSID